jgi:hypothetical protein
MRSDGLKLYWEWLMTLPREEQHDAMLQLLHQLIIEIANLENGKR